MIKYVIRDENIIAGDQRKEKLGVCTVCSIDFFINNNVPFLDLQLIRMHSGLWKYTSQGYGAEYTDYKYTRTSDLNTISIKTLSSVFLNTCELTNSILESEREGLSFKQKLKHCIILTNILSCRLLTTSFIVCFQLW